MRRIYIAGAFETQWRLRLERDRLEAAGLGKVVGTWLDEETGNSLEISSALSREYATRDFAEIHTADLLIVDTVYTNMRGGREVEYGYANGLGIETWVVGPRRNVFHHLAPAFETWAEVRDALAKEAQEARV